MSFNSLAATALLSLPMQDDEASTAVVDYATGGVNGTVVGGNNTADISVAGDSVGKALQMDGSADYITANNMAALGIGETMTVSAKIRVDTYGSDDILLCANVNPNNVAAYGLGWYARQKSGYWQFVVAYAAPEFGFSSVNTTYRPTTGQWVHLLLVVSLDDLKVYLDGLLNASNHVASVGLGSSDALQIGATSGFNSYATFELLEIWDSDQSANALELAAGPELNYVAGASLESDGTFSVGTWTLPSQYTGGNGTATYEWRVKVGESVVDSGTGTSGTATLGSGLNSLEVRATNDGGYDVGDSGDGWYAVASVLAANGAISPSIAGAYVNMLAHHVLGS